MVINYDVRVGFKASKRVVDLRFERMDLYPDERVIERRKSLEPSFQPSTPPVGATEEERMEWALEMVGPFAEENSRSTAFPETLLLTCFALHCLRSLPRDDQRLALRERLNAVRFHLDDLNSMTRFDAWRFGDRPTSSLVPGAYDVFARLTLVGSLPEVSTPGRQAGIPPANSWLEFGYSASRPRRGRKIDLYESTVTTFMALLSRLAQNFPGENDGVRDRLEAFAVSCGLCADPNILPAADEKLEYVAFQIADVAAAQCL